MRVSSTPQVNIPEQMTQIPHNAMSLYDRIQFNVYTGVHRYILHRLGYENRECYKEI